MTAEGLRKIEAGRRVFVDSSIFIYHFTGASVQRRDLLKRCETFPKDLHRSPRCEPQA